MAERAKAKAVVRNGKVSLCVLDETWPFAYLQVYCDALIDDDGETLVDVMMAVAERMSGEPLAPELRPMVKAMAEEEGRVLVRCRPYATFVTPPRHLHRNDQEEQADPLGLGDRCPGTLETRRTRCDVSLRRGRSLGPTLTREAGYVELRRKSWPYTDWRRSRSAFPTSKKRLGTTPSSG